jgi:hypothetical protein
MKSSTTPARSNSPSSFTDTLVVVAMQRLALAVGENQEMRGGEIEIILRHFDAERSRHGRDVNQKLPALSSTRERCGKMKLFIAANFTCISISEALVERTMLLGEALDLRRGEMTALIGAGGKTTTMLRLARELREEGRKILLNHHDPDSKAQQAPCRSIVFRPRRSTRWRKLARRSLRP